MIALTSVAVLQSTALQLTQMIAVKMLAMQQLF
jgi:hypothetical protein